jgi:hypothetical protein
MTNKELVNLNILCKYEREGSVSGHWCNLCPTPISEYVRIERAEELAFKARNSSKKKKNGQSK